MGTERVWPFGSRTTKYRFPRAEVNRTTGKVRPKKGWVESMTVTNSVILSVTVVVCDVCFSDGRWSSARQQHRRAGAQARGVVEEERALLQERARSLGGSHTTKSDRDLPI